MFKSFQRVSLVTIIFLLSITSYAQGLGNSPYSRLGIGDVSNYKGSVRNMGMGYAGSLLGSKNYMNILNPAGLTNFKGDYKDSLVKIDVGYTIQRSTYSSGENSSTSFGANINYLAFAFPVSRRFATGIILTPFTTVQNNYTYKQSIPNDPNNYTANYSSKGSGGIYQFQWINGYGLTKNISVGLTTNFNFGSINQESTSQLSDSANVLQAYQYGYSSKTSYSGVSFKPGLIYRKQLYRYVDSITKKPTGVFLSVGGTVEISSGIKSMETKDIFVKNTSNTIVSDSNLLKARSPAYFPATYRAAFALQKEEKWTLAMDLSYSDWSAYNKHSMKSDSLSNSSYSVFLGGEYFKFSQRRPIKSKTYRAGFMYSASPFVIEGNRVHDYSMSIGATLPVGTRINQKGIPILPKLNVALVVGQRTTLHAEQLSELYFRLNLSMVIYDKWFTRRKIE